MSWRFATIGLLGLLAATVAAGESTDDFALRPDSRLVFESGYNADKLFNDGPTRRWSMGGTYTALTLNRSYQGWYCTFALRHTSPHGSISYSESGGLVLLARPPEPHVRALLSARSSNGKISTGIWWQIGREDQQEGGIAGQWQPVQSLCASLEYSHHHPLAFQTELYYDGEGGLLEWSAPASVWRYTVHITSANWWSISSETSVANLSPGQPQDGNTLSNGYLAAVDGLWRDGLFRIETVPFAYAKIAGEYREISADTRLQGFWDGHRFAHFGVLEFAARLWSLRFTLGHFQVRLEKGKAEGDLAGTVEAWPFTEGLARFIGERRHLVGTGVLTWKGTDLSDDIRIGRRVRLRTGLRYLYVEPDVRYTTWRPVAFGLGIDDLQWGRLEVRSAHLLHIALKPQVDFHQWSLELAAGQWIPLAVRKGSATSGNNTGDSDVPPPSAQTDNSRRHSGFSFSANLSLSL